MTSDSTPTPNALDVVAMERRVIVCVGSGGVGKTTSSAVIALHAALRGRKVLVLTIDPARRLANSLGVEALDDTAREVPLERFRDVGLEPKGQLFAMMLDMKQAFDRLIDQHAPDEATRTRILSNRFYSFFSTSLAGTQEYSAMERLRELYLETDFDLIVLDTPPTTHALDFLDAPNRLFEALDSSALQWVARSSKAGLSLFKLGAASVMKLLSRFTGGGFLKELAEFIESFDSMWAGFKARAAETKRILAGDDVAFYIVTSPDSITLDEALFFFRRLEDEGMPIGGVVVNRVHQGFVPKPVLSSPPREVERRLREFLDQPDTSDSEHHAAIERARALDLTALSQHLLENAREFHVLAHQDEDTLDTLQRKLGRYYPIHPVPFFSTDIHSLKGLARLRDALFSLDDAPTALAPDRS